MTLCNRHVPYNNVQYVYAMQEYPFYTITSLPDGVLTHIGGLVTARSVKLLDKINNPGTTLCLHFYSDFLIGFFKFVSQMTQRLGMP